MWIIVNTHRLDSHVDHTVNTNEPAQYVDNSEHTETCTAAWTTQ